MRPAGAVRSADARPDPGDQYGRLFVVRQVQSRNGKRHFDCRCTCGTDVIVCGSKMASCHTQSCGCLKRERFSRTGATKMPGLRRTGDPTYASFRAMRHRCGPNSSVPKKDPISLSQSLTMKQINTVPMLLAKDGPPRAGGRTGGPGHKLYEQQRAIEGAIVKQGGKATAAQLAELDRLQGEAKILYAKAREVSYGG